MQVKIIAIGTRMPKWVTEGFTFYSSRLPATMPVKLIEINSQKRLKHTHIPQVLEQEGTALFSATHPQDHIVALERSGKSLDTYTFAEKLQSCQENGQSISFLIGGPEGIASSCLQKVHEIWSLSELTLPHPLVRVLIAEQIYRAWSILNHHPYHR